MRAQYVERIFPYLLLLVMLGSIPWFIFIKIDQEKKVQAKEAVYIKQGCVQRYTDRMDKVFICKDGNEYSAWRD